MPFCSAYLRKINGIIIQSIAIHYHHYTTILFILFLKWQFTEKVNYVITIPEKMMKWGKSAFLNNLGRVLPRNTSDMHQGSFQSHNYNVIENSSPEYMFSDAKLHFLYHLYKGILHKK